MSLVVCDTGPVLRLREAGALDLLAKTGEAEAIALARSVRADWLLTDDAGARIVASLLGLEAHGSMAVVLWSAGSGHLQRDGALAAFEGLTRSSLWISPRIVDEARHALNRLLP